MATTTTNLGLPRPVAADNVTLASQQALIDAIDANVAAMPTSSMSRQAIINGNFDIAQRGTSFTNPVGSYTLDRWVTDFGADGGTFPTSILHSQQTLTPADLYQSKFCYRVNVNGAGSGFGANVSYTVRQRIENGTRYLCGSGKKFTVSFQARSSIAGKRIGVYAVQRYGTGGSPSAPETLSGNNFTLSSTLTKHSVTFTANTLSGKTFGTNNDDTLEIVFIHVWGSASYTQLNTSTAETFVGSGTIDIAQVQVNAGDVALPFQPRSFGDELALCRRYCYAFSDDVSGVGFAYTTTQALFYVPFQQKMRVIPTLVINPAQCFISDGVTPDITTTGAIVNNVGRDTVALRGAVAGGLTVGRPYFLRRSTGSTDVIIFDAEL